MKKFALLLLLTFTHSVFGQNLELDYSFGTDGFVTLPMDSDAGSFNVNRIQNDGKILVCGQRLNGTVREDFIARYNPDGTIDTSFANNGFYICNDTINDINGPNFFILSNGKIICVIGDVQGEITKLNTDRNVDTTFGTNGKMNFNYFNDGTAYLDANDNLYVGSGTLNQLIKINTITGTLDTSFGTNGIINLESSFGKIYSFENDKFLVKSNFFDSSTIPTTYHPAIKRFNSNGTLDTSFGTNGTLLLYYTTTPSELNSIIFNVDVDHSNSVLYVTQSSFSSFITTIRKFDSNGNLISSFGNSGTVTLPANNDIIRTQLHNNKLYLAGANNAIANYNTTLLRYDANGAVDYTFHSNGIYIENTNSLLEWAKCISVNPDGSLIVSGEYINGNMYKLFLAKYIPSTLNNTTFGADFDIKYNNPMGDQLEFFSNKTIASIALYNLYGKQVGFSCTNQIETANLASGMYIAKVTSSDDESKIVKVVKN